MGDRVPGEGGVKVQSGWSGRRAGRIILNFGKLAKGGIGMKGRKPKPTKLHVLNGNPSRKDLNTNEPKPKPVAPKPPSWLRKEAKKEWKRAAKELEQLGLLTQIDMAAFAGYCQSYAKWKEAEVFLQENGMTYELNKYDDEGEVISTYYQQYPEVSIAKQCLDQIRQFCAEFGMTPSARSRIQLPSNENSEDEMEVLLTRNR